MGSTARVLSAMRVAGVGLALVVAAGGATAYVSFVAEQRQYFTGRNFRLLGTLAKQFDGTIRAETRVLAGLAREDPQAAGDAASLRDRWMRIRQGRYPASDLQLHPSGKAGPDTVAEYAYEARPDFGLVVQLRDPSSVAPPHAFARLRLERVLGPIFEPTLTRAFDTIVLTTQDGTVLYGAGTRLPELRSSGLAALVGRHKDGPAQATAFSDLVRTSAVDDIAIGGVSYKLFVQPCCAPTEPAGKPLVMAGLVEADLFRSQSWAISTTLVKLAIMGMLIAVIAWPFLKLALMGDRQKVRLADLFQLGASCVAGLAILTVFILDVSAYWQLRRDTDRQLKALAESIDRNATAEIAAAYRQLACLDRSAAAYLARPRASAGAAASAGEPGPANSFGSVLADERFRCQRSAPSAGPGALDVSHPGPSPAPPQAGLEPYPFFETFALIDAAGAQTFKLATTDTSSRLINVGERPYFRMPARDRGWRHPSMCPDGGGCWFESVWSWTTAEALAVLATTRLSADGMTLDAQFPVAAISIPMRSLIRPVLPPGFEFAVIDQAGKVLFHSDRQRNTSEDFFEETDNNRRLRAQVAAHTAQPMNIRYWGSAYRAFIEPMELKDTYVVVMAQKDRTWAINREWLVVALILLAGYLAVWLVVALATLGKDVSWVWPNPAHRHGYYGVMGLCLLLLMMAGVALWDDERNSLLFWGAVLPLTGWIGTRVLLRQPRKGLVVPSKEPVAVYSIAAVLLLLVTGVVPGALLFVASFQLHAQSFIKNSQLVVARALAERSERLWEEYGKRAGGREADVCARIGRARDLDLYFGLMYDTTIREGGDAAGATGCRPSDRPSTHAAAAAAGEHHGDDMVLSFLEEYLPYYSEASVEWRELLHEQADDGSWVSRTESDARLSLTITHQGGVPITLTSRVPTIVGFREIRSTERHAPTLTQLAGMLEADGAGAAGHAAPPSAGERRLTGAGLLLIGGLIITGLAWGVVRVFARYIFLVGVTEPLWASVRLALNAGDSMFVLCDKDTKAHQIANTVPLKLGPIARQPDVPGQWRRALIGLDRGSAAGGAVLVDDFDEDLDDTTVMDVKLTLLEDLVADPSRTVVVLSQLSATGLSDSLRRSAQGEPLVERWRRLLKAFVLVEWRDGVPPAEGPSATVEIQGPRDCVPAGQLPGSAAAWMPAPLHRAASTLLGLRMQQVLRLLDAEGRAHPHVERVCAELRGTDAVRDGTLSLEQAFDEIAERTAQCYRRIWASCSDDEKLVLGHIAQHGLANASVRRVVRRLLGRRLLFKDPALRPMNESFRRFILSSECRCQVSELETTAGPSAWDRLRSPLAAGVVGLGLFLFATQRELYNALLGVTTAAAVSVPTLIRAVGLLAGRRAAEGDTGKTA